MTKEQQVSDQKQEVTSNQTSSQAAQTEDFSLLGAQNDDLKVVPEGQRPDFLDENLWDSDKKDIKKDLVLSEYKKMQDRVKGLRDKLARGEGKPPKDANGYTLPEADETVAPILNPKDPFVSELKNFAHKANMTNEQYQTFVTHAAKFLAENGPKLTEPEPLTDDQIREIKEKEYTKIGPNAPRVVRAVSEWARQMLDSGYFSEDEIKLVNGIGSSGEGVKLLNKIRTLTGGSDIPVSTNIDDGLPSDKEIFEMFGDKRYNEDTNFRNKIDKLMHDRVRAGRPSHLQV